MIYKLNNWYVAPVGFAPYKAPEQQESVLWGDVSLHPGYNEGDHIHTSKPVGKRDGLVLTVSGSLYELGEPKENYEALYPGAKERLLATLPELPEPGSAA